MNNVIKTIVTEIEYSANESTDIKTIKTSASKEGGEFNYNLNVKSDIGIKYCGIGTDLDDGIVVNINHSRENNIPIKKSLYECDRRRNVLLSTVKYYDDEGKKYGNYIYESKLFGDTAKCVSVKIIDSKHFGVSSEKIYHRRYDGELLSASEIDHYLSSGHVYEKYTTNVYDVYGNLIETTITNNDIHKRKVYSYDRNDNIIKCANFFTNHPNCNSDYILLKYDDKNRIIQKNVVSDNKRSYNNEVLKLSYNEEGLVVAISYNSNSFIGEEECRRQTCILNGSVKLDYTTNDDGTKTERRTIKMNRCFFEDNQTFKEKDEIIFETVYTKDAPLDKLYKNILNTESNLITIYPTLDASECLECIISRKILKSESSIKGRGGDVLTEEVETVFDDNNRLLSRIITSPDRIERVSYEYKSDTTDEFTHSHYKYESDNTGMDYETITDNEFDEYGRLIKTIIKAIDSSDDDVLEDSPDEEKDVVSHIAERHLSIVDKYMNFSYAKIEF